MLLHFIETLSDEDYVGNILGTLEKNEQVRSILILACDESYSDISHLLKPLKKTVFGGLFPQLIYRGERKKTGMIIAGLPNETETLLLHGKLTEEEIYNQISKSFPDVDPHDKSLFIFTDALHFNKNGLIDSLYNYFGTFLSYIGGGTGSLSFRNIPSIFSNEGIVSEAAIIGLYHGRISIGVDHGYEAVSESFKVTESVENKIVTLDWKPAMEVYRQVVEQHSGTVYDGKDFLAFAKSYPFGINKVDSQMVIRDPFKEEENSIYTLDTIEQGSYINVVYAKEENLVSGAGKARLHALNNPQIKNSGAIFVVDCITRSLFLEESYQNELNALDPAHLAFGALTLGEIANFGNAYLEIYNKTAVIGIFEHD